MERRIMGIRLPKFLQHSSPKPYVKRRSIKAPVHFSLRRVLTQNTDEFCRNTTLHGLKYIASKELYPIERIFFAISFVAVMLISGFFIFKVYGKWTSTPVILGINPVPTFIADEPFPAVTICNLNQAMKSIVQNYTIHSTEYAMLQLLCKRAANNTIASTITDWSKLHSFILNISQPCERMVVACRFGAVEYNCSEMFHPIITDEGLCCVFNMLHPKFMFRPNIGSFVHIGNVTNGNFTPIDWYAEGGYPEILPDKFTPRVAAGTGESLGFSVVLDVEIDEYYCSSSNSAGFKIALHSPNESPNVRETGLLLSHGKEIKVRIQPEKFITDCHLRSIDKKYRHCLFHNEAKLLYFSHYTQRNCEMECVARMMVDLCGCISFYMPKIYVNTTICSIHDVSCVERVRLKTDPSIENCYDNCLPSCYDLTFLPDFFSNPISHNGFEIINQDVQNFTHDYVERNIAVVNMYFKENSFRSKIQTEFIGISDFLSSVGGLMGLFLGFSFISIVEFIYFAIIRPYRALTQQNVSQTNAFEKQSILAKNSSKKKSPLNKENVHFAAARRQLKKRSAEQYRKFGNVLYPKLTIDGKNNVYNRFAQSQFKSNILHSISESIESPDKGGIYSNPLE